MQNTKAHVTKSENAKKKKGMKDQVMCCDIEAWVPYIRYPVASNFLISVC